MSSTKQNFGQSNRELTIISTAVLSPLATVPIALETAFIIKNLSKTSQNKVNAFTAEINAFIQAQPDAPASSVLTPSVHV